MLAYSEDEHLFTDTECNLIIEAIDNCRIIDPACGSGAFLMGMLIKMVFILHKLDPDNEKWKQQQIDTLNASIKQAKSSNLDNIEVSKAIDALNSSIEDIKCTFNNYDYDFSRKLFLIEHCVYGSDIQPIAIHIAKLRFFISLLVDQKIVCNLPNNGVRALPNLETNLIAADSLVTINMQNQTDFITAQVDKVTLCYIEQLKTIHHEHFFARSRDKKKRIRLSEDMLRKKYATDLEKLQVGHQIANKIAKWNPYASNDYAEFFDPSIMFGFERFDIVIGNPPFVESRNSLFTESQKNLLQGQIQSLYSNDSRFITRGSDLLTYFIERSINLIKPNGIACMITQNSWLSTDYGSKFSRFLLKYCDVLRVIDSDYKYFDTIQINTVISMITSKQSCSNSICFEVYNSKYNEFPEKKRCRAIRYNDPNITGNKWDLFLANYDIIADLALIKSKGSGFSVNRYISVGQGLNLAAEYKYKRDDLLARGVPENCLIPFFTTYDDAPFELTSTCMCLVDEKINSHSTLKLNYFDYSTTRKNPPIISLPRGLGRHYACLNTILAYTDSNVDIYASIPVERTEALRIWLFLNSSMFWLIRELLGRKNLGGGMLKAEAADIKDIPLYHKFNDVQLISNIFDSISRRKALNTVIEIDSDEHLKIDKLVSQYFGFDASKTQQIHDALIDCITRRTKKAKNV